MNRRARRAVAAKARRGPDYRLRFLRALDALDLAPGTVSNVLVEHDPDCPFDRGEMCSCRPAMSVVADGKVRVIGDNGAVEEVRAS
jgi:hypothetical protein